MTEVTATEPKRITVTNEDFLRVTVVEHAKYPTIAAAAAALGMEESSFRQRMTRERKNHPSIFGSVSYRSNSGPRKATTAELADILNKLQGNG